MEPSPGQHRPTRRVLICWALGSTQITCSTSPHHFARHQHRGSNRIRQAHIALILMGVLLTAVGAAAGAVPPWNAVLLIVGAMLQAVMFLPLAIDDAIQQ